MSDYFFKILYQTAIVSPPPPNLKKQLTRLLHKCWTFLTMLNLITVIGNSMIKTSYINLWF